MPRSILEQIKAFNWRQWVVVFLFLVAVGFSGLYALRTVRHAVYWRLHRDEPIRGWMNVRYVSHSYHVPPHVLYEALGMEDRQSDRRPLRHIARQQHRSMDDIRQTLQEAIDRFRANNPRANPAQGSSGQGSPG